MFGIGKKAVPKPLEKGVARVPVVAAESVPARGLRSGIDRFWRQWPLLAG